MQPIRLIRGFLTVGVWTLASRVLGFARDIIIAATLGTGPVAEAFLVAFALPNMFRRFFAEGAFNMAFVPMFSKKIEAGEDAEGFAREAFAGLGTVLIVFTLAAQVAMPVLVLAMASGFVDDQRFDLAVLYGRITFPYVLFISLAALLSGVLNSVNRFVAAAAAPVLLNILLVGSMLVAGWRGWSVGDALVWMVPVAGVAQLALVWVSAARAGFRMGLQRPRWTPEMRRLVVIAGPAALAGGVMQVNLLVGRQVASFFEGAVAWLSYADRLYQLPLGVIGIAIGVVLLPDLSRRLRADDTEGGRHAFNRAAEMALTLTVPAALAFLAVPAALVSVLFERGQFDASDTQATAIALAVYGAGLPAFVLQKVLQPLYFAREDTTTPFRYALVGLTVNAVVAIGLAPVLGFVAAAIGTTLAGWTMAVLLWRGSRAMGPAAMPDDRFRRRVWRILAASVGMAVVLGLVARAGAPLLESDAWRYGALALLVTLGMGVYYLLGTRMGAFALSDIRGAVRR